MRVPVAGGAGVCGINGSTIVGGHRTSNAVKPVNRLSSFSDFDNNHMKTTKHQNSYDSHEIRRKMRFFYRISALALAKIKRREYVS